jgi:hypothetical protein
MEVEDTVIITLTKSGLVTVDKDSLFLLCSTEKA